VWSLDWEGFGVNQFDLDDIVDISTKYEMPIVQYFNPRIYLENSSGSGVNKGAASYYTSWVLGRKAKGDEIGLHIHLYPDLIDGVEKHFATDTTPDDDSDEPVVDQIEPIYQPAGLVGIGRTENSLAAYSREDLVKIFQWSLDKFKENNLPFPTSFRSGAWMSSTNVLSALEGVGIAIDSSGRTGGDLNPSIPSSNDIPWSLSATTYPYKPDKGNINTWSSGDRFNVWEFPNNGADSYWFSKEELISRFDANYKGKNYVVKRAQVVTYLSHPHGFKQFDSAKIRAALEHASKFKYKDDNGPVVFGTFENIFKEWPKENINGN
jgi:hypothetical protein